MSEEDGGGSVSGHGLLDLTLVAEEMGRWVSPGPLLPTNVVAAALSELRDRGPAGDVPARASSAVRPSPPGVSARPGASALPGAVTLEATRRGGEFVLSGRKGAAEAAAEADLFVVAALVDGEPTQFLVDGGCPGGDRVTGRGIDLVRRFAMVAFEGVVLPPDAVLGEVGGAAGQIERLFELAVALQCASMAGVVDRVLAFTLEYSFDRYSFGRPLASYQALKHRFADMKTVDRGVAGHGGGRRTGGRQPLGGLLRAGERGQVLHRGPGDGDPSGLRPAARWHRGHLGPRPAPLHPARRAGPRPVRDARTSTGSAIAGTLGLEETNGR